MFFVLIKRLILPTASIILLVMLVFMPNMAAAADNNGQGGNTSGQNQSQSTDQQNDDQQIKPDIQSATCQGAELQFKTEPLSGDECNFGDNNPEERLNDLVAGIINLFSVVVGIVAVMMIIWGGFKYITSGGDSANVTGAKNTILYAIVGLVIVAFAQFIVKFVLARAAGVAGT